MDQGTKILEPLRDVQTPVAFSRLQAAMTVYVEDLNARFNAGFAVRRNQTTFAVHELEKADALLSVSLMDNSDIQYSQVLKRSNERQSGIIVVRACEVEPALMCPACLH